MKSNAHLYLPWSVIEDWLAGSRGCQFTEARGRPSIPLASIVELEGGCVLYRLTPREQSDMAGSAT